MNELNALKIKYFLIVQPFYKKHIPLKTMELNGKMNLKVICIFRRLFKHLWCCNCHFWYTEFQREK